MKHKSILIELKWEGNETYKPSADFITKNLALTF